MEDTHITTAQLSREINLTPKTIHRYEKKGMPFIWLGNKKYYDLPKVVAWFQENFKTGQNQGKLEGSSDTSGNK